MDHLSFPQVSSIVSFQKFFFSHKAAPTMSSLCRTGSCPRPSNLLGSKPPNPASIPSSSLTRTVAQLPINTTKPRAEQDRRNSNSITFQQKDFSAAPKESQLSKIRTTKDLSRSAWVTCCRQPDIALQQISGQWKGVKVLRDWENRCNWGKWGWWLCVDGEHGQPAQQLSWGSLQGRPGAPQSWQGGSFKINQVFQITVFSSKKPSKAWRQSRRVLRRGHTMGNM